MNTIRFFTSGESHGKSLVGIIDGLPSGFALAASDINDDLLRRQGGYGRGGRMKIESDCADILSGVRWGKTLGSPITLLIKNNDWENWQKGMSELVDDEGSISPVILPRPGHADLAGAIKYDTKDVRNILERSSARETAMRVALGAVAKKILSEFGIVIGSYVCQIGSARYNKPIPSLEKDLLALFRTAEQSPVRCPDKAISNKMVACIDKAKRNNYSLGGLFTVFAIGLPMGLGSHVQWDRKLDGQLAQAIMSIQAIKGVEIGSGFEMASQPGSEVMDEIYYRKSPDPEIMPFFRKTNHAGGIEGGMTNGMPVALTVAMKPIPTLRKPLGSVDIITKRSFAAAYERSDVCAVPAAAVVGEAMVALTMVNAFLEKFGGDSRKEILHNYKSYRSYIRKY
ncbi:MAG: chorismate synthase [Nitrospirota bacterium]|nr:chorismate synthase [Nitrospirota bacterium]